MSILQRVLDENEQLRAKISELEKYKERFEGIEKFKLSIIHQHESSNEEWSVWLPEWYSLDALYYEGPILLKALDKAINFSRRTNHWM